MRSLEEEGSSWELGDRAGHLRSSGDRRPKHCDRRERMAGTASALMMFGFYCKWKGNH